MEGNNSSADLWGMTEKGTYGIELSANDNHNPPGKGKDTVLITRNPAIPVYFNYLSRENPVMKNPGVHRYGLLAVVILFCSLPVLIFNAFTIKNFTNKSFRSL